MKIVEVIVEHVGKNLSAYIEGAPVITVGNDMKELEDNMKEAIELYLEDNSNPCEVLSGEFGLKFILAATLIDSTELRRGNYLLLRDRIVAVGGIPNHICLLIPGEKYAVDLEEFVSVPISCELLLKCGFREENDNFYRADLGTISFNQYGYYIQMKECSSGIIRVIKITSLHKLQNLYFALTGKELEVNL